MAVISFFCDPCGLDQDLSAFQNRNSVAPRPWWEARCPRCGRKVVRYTGNVADDPYYRKSKRVRLMAAEHADELVQYGQPGFALLYPAQWQRFEAERERYEAALQRRKAERAALWDRHRGDASARRAVETVLRHEESMENA